MAQAAPPGTLPWVFPIDPSAPMARPVPSPNGLSLDALPPVQIARRAAETGIAKAALDARRTFVLAVLAGAFIALGALFATTVTAGAGEALSFGVTRLLAGLVFSLGLVLVVVAGAELFTGNNLIVMAAAQRQVTVRRLLRNWAIVYAGNLVGAVATAAIVFAGRQHEFGGGAVGTSALQIGDAKAGLEPLQMFALGILCNALVCLAVWLAMSARSVADKVIAIVFPITAFVAMGFEHSIANMYFFASALLIKAGASDSFWSATGSAPERYGDLDLWHAAENVSIVTAGNIVGGSLLVGAVYWLVYLRRA